MVASNGGSDHSPSRARFLSCCWNDIRESRRSRYSVLGTTHSSSKMDRRRSRQMAVGDPDSYNQLLDRITAATPSAAAAVRNTRREIPVVVLGSPCPTTLVEGRLLLTRDLDRREPMPAVSAPRDGPRRRLAADGLLWKAEQDDSLRCTARANDHAARNNPPGSSYVIPLALASPKRRRVARVSSS